MQYMFNTCFSHLSAFFDITLPCFNIRIKSNLSPLLGLPGFTEKLWVLLVYFYFFISTSCPALLSEQTCQCCNSLQPPSLSLARSETAGIHPPAERQDFVKSTWSC